MNITFKQKNTVPYVDLDIGDVFTYGGHVFMVTDEYTDGDPSNPKAVNLSNGEMEKFEDTNVVNMFDNVTCVLE